MVTVFAFILAIGVLVAVHEWGHYRAAVFFGVKVLRFSIGFGPRIWGWKSSRSGTDFVVGLLPLGGYVKMLDEREGIVAPEERSQAFNVQRLRSRAAIVAAGPVANLVFAIILYACVNWIGLEQAQAILSKPAANSVASQAGLLGGEWVQRAAFEGEALNDIASFDDLRWWLTRGALAHRNVQVEFVRPKAGGFSGDAGVALLSMESIDARNADASMFQRIGITGPFSKPELGALAVDGAAHQAGLRQGDVVLRLDQTDIVDAGQLRELIRNAGASGAAPEQMWWVNRAGQQSSFAVRPRVEIVDGTSVARVGAYIGMRPAMVTVQYGAWDGFERAMGRTWEVSVLTLKMMGKIATGDASLRNLSGPLTIADYAGKSAAMGFVQFLIFLALISISLGVLNLLPLPVLDGGHLMYYLWESLAGKPVSETWMDRLQRVGLAILLMMMSIAVFNDVVRLLA